MICSCSFVYYSEFVILSSVNEYIINLLSCHHICVFSAADVNDNVPFFTSSIYEASVTEGAQIGTLVLQVSAHDKDLGLNGEVCV